MLCISGDVVFVVMLCYDNDEANGGGGDGCDGGKKAPKIGTESSVRRGVLVQVTVYFL
jgi:hypothetical protein